MGDLGPILRFKDKYKVFSNFYPFERNGNGKWVKNGELVVEYEGREYPSVEHAFQAAKAESEHEREWIGTAPDPAEAKKRGRWVKLRPGWDRMRVGVMEKCIESKFGDRNIQARRALVLTGTRKLVEGNWWGDTFWGFDENRREGENWLGWLLERRRTRLRRELRVVVFGSRPAREIREDLTGARLRKWKKRLWDLDIRVERRVVLRAIQQRKRVRLKFSFVGR
jgi:ribA/ribD-fused uncharacterized protein